MSSECSPEIPTQMRAASASPRFATSSFRLGAMLVAFVSFGFCATTSADETTAPSFRVQANEVRVLGPIEHDASPRGSDGLEWMAPTFDDARWQLGSLRELNSIPEGRSRLYRTKLTLIGAPPAGVQVMLHVDADDGLRVWLDGFSLGEWGSGKDSKLAGLRSIDLTDRLSGGVHTLALRVDNGIAGSKLDARIDVIAAESPEALKAGNWFRKNFNSLDERLRGAAIARARAVVESHPDDADARWMALSTYYSIDPPDLTGAHALVQMSITRGISDAPGGAIPLLVDFGEYEAIGALIERGNWGSDPEKFKLFNQGQYLFHSGRREEAIAVLRSAVTSYGKVPVYGWRVNCLLDAGVLDKVGPAVRREVERAEGSGSIPSYPALADSLMRLGDYSRARRLYATFFQSYGAQAIAPLSQIALLTGDFAEAERLCREAITNLTVTETRGRIARRMLQVRLAIALHAQGKLAELASLRSELDLQDFPNQPQFTLTAIRSTLHPRLRIAMLGDDRVALEAAAISLYNALKERASKSPCLDVDPDILADLALGLRESGKDQEMQHVCGLIERSVAGIALPVNQAALGRAAALSGNKDAARKHLGDAALLAPDDWWIKQELAALGK